jgi:hypothetical protein
VWENVALTSDVPPAATHTFECLFLERERFSNAARVHIHYLKLVCIRPPSNCLCVPASLCHIHEDEENDFHGIYMDQHNFEWGNSATPACRKLAFHCFIEPSNYKLYLLPSILLIGVRGGAYVFVVF